MCVLVCLVNTYVYVCIMENNSGILGDAGGGDGQPRQGKPSAKQDRPTPEQGT